MVKKELDNGNKGNSTQIRTFFRVTLHHSVCYPLNFPLREKGRKEGRKVGRKEEMKREGRWEGGKEGRSVTHCYIVGDLGIEKS